MSTLTQLFSNIADAIRSKTGDTGKIQANNFPAEILGIATGTDTTDGTATADDIEAGKTAYVNGEKITGNLTGVYKIPLRTVEPKVSGSNVVMEYRSDLGRKILTSNALIQVAAPLTSFGDATVADVAEGKTFTSAAGLKVTGTAKTPFILLAESEKDYSFKTGESYLGKDFFPKVGNYGYIAIDLNCEELSVSQRYESFGGYSYVYYLTRKNSSEPTGGISLILSSNSIWSKNSQDHEVKVHIKVTIYEFA